MDSARFDGLVRRVGQIQSRRQTLRSLAGAVVVGVLALGAPEVSADTCKAAGQACKTNAQCCSNTCVGGTGGGSSGRNGVCQAASTCTPLGAACAFSDPGACCSQGCCAASMAPCQPGVDPCCCNVNQLDGR